MGLGVGLGVGVGVGVGERVGNNISALHLHPHAPLPNPQAAKYGLKVGIMAAKVFAGGGPPFDPTEFLIEKLMDMVLETMMGEFGGFALGLWKVANGDLDGIIDMVESLQVSWGGGVAVLSPFCQEALNQSPPPPLPPPPPPPSPVGDRQKVLE